VAKKDNTESTTEEQPAAATTTETATERKSIVPAGWKSKKDALSEFINEQSSGKEGFEYPAFFALCRKNAEGSLTEEKIAHYEGLVASGAHGAQGRAKMTLRNMLATVARKNGSLIGLNDEKTALDLPKPTVAGAAAKAQEAAAEQKEAAE
jgi:hypothetical protein